MLIAAFLVVTACSVTGPKLVPSGLVEVELSGLFIRPLDNRPVTWLTVKVTNNSDKVFFETRSKVDDISNSVNLYGRSDGFIGSGFSSNPEIAWPKDLEILEPGKFAYVSLNLGEPRGPEIEINLSLINKKGYIARVVKTMDIGSVEPINQMPGE